MDIVALTATRPTLPLELAGASSENEYSASRGGVSTAFHSPPPVDLSIDDAAKKASHLMKLPGGKPQKPETPVAGPKSQKRGKFETSDAATYLGLARHTLAKLRVTGGGPPFHKLGSRVVYDLG